MHYRLRRLLYRSAFPIILLYWVLRRPTTHGAVCLVVHTDQLLMVKNTYGFRRWTLPGGYVKADEPPQLAAQRELAEETGLVATNLKLVGEFKLPIYMKIDHIWVFRAEVASPADVTIDPGEIAQYQWFSLSLLPSKRSPVADYILSHYAEHLT